MYSFLFLATTLFSFVPESRLQKELDRTFGRAVWLFHEESPAIEIGSHLYFTQGSADLTRAHASVIGQLARLLLRFPNLKVEMIGSASSTGNEAVDERTARNRASAARNHLLAEVDRLCGGQGSAGSCEGWSKSIRATVESPSVLAVTGTPQRQAVDRVRILLSF